MLSIHQVRYVIRHKTAWRLLFFLHVLPRNAVSIILTLKKCFNPYRTFLSYFGFGYILMNPRNERSRRDFFVDMIQMWTFAVIFVFPSFQSFLGSVSDTPIKNFGGFFIFTLWIFIIAQYHVFTWHPPSLKSSEVILSRIFRWPATWLLASIANFHFRWRFFIWCWHWMDEPAIKVLHTLLDGQGGIFYRR